MIQYDKLAKHPRIFKTLIGLNTEGFRQLLPTFKRAREAELERRAGRLRYPRRGGRRRGCLADTADNLVFRAVLFPALPHQSMQGLLFGMGQPQVNMWIHRLTPHPKAAFGYKKKLLARKPRVLAYVHMECEGLEFIVDGVECLSNPKRQRQFYNDKKKRHTFKNNVIVERHTGKIRGLSITCEGKRHDKKFAEVQGLRFLKARNFGRTPVFRDMNPRCHE